MKSIYNNLKDIEFVPVDRHLLAISRSRYALNMIREDNVYIPRFKMLNVDSIAGIYINKPMQPTIELFKKAIEVGMVFNILYRGEEDNSPSGHERTIYPMVLGYSLEREVLLRGYHLNGWSVSSNGPIEKIWRMFRLDNILSVTFTGSLYRLPPDGYNTADPGMRGGIIKKADFSIIRMNQSKLVSSAQVQDRDDVSLDNKGKLSTIYIKGTDTTLDLENAMENPLIKNMADLANTRICFLKGLYGAKYLAVVGAISKVGTTVTVIADNKNLGAYRVIDSIVGETLKKIKKITKGQKTYDVYLFDRKQ